MTIDFTNLKLMAPRGNRNTRLAPVRAYVNVHKSGSVGVRIAVLDELFEDLGWHIGDQLVRFTSGREIIIAKCTPDLAKVTRQSMPDLVSNSSLFSKFGSDRLAVVAIHVTAEFISGTDIKNGTIAVEHRIDVATTDDGDTVKFLVISL